MTDRIGSSHTPVLADTVRFTIQIKAALLIPVMFSPMYGWVTEEELKELR